MWKTDYSNPLIIGYNFQEYIRNRYITNKTSEKQKQVHTILLEKRNVSGAHYISWIIGKWTKNIYFLLIFCLKKSVKLDWWSCFPINVLLSVIQI